MKKGILLVNLGSPKKLSVASVRAYLREFLSDPRVIDVPFIIRMILLYVIILPLRPAKTFAAYKKVWTGKGSPLVVYGKDICSKVSVILGEEYQVELAMRYAQYPIAQTISKLQNCSSITLVPLFPQYASATTGSIIEKFMNIMANKNNIPQINIVNSFYDNKGFIKCYAEVINNTLSNKKIDKLIFSFHGLPVRQIAKAGCKKKCQDNIKCPDISSNNFYCYRAQCYATASLIAKEIGFTEDAFTVTFQSRLGRTPWIQPYTDEYLTDLAKTGAKNIAIACPSFVADCLETIEEIGMEAKEQWLELGGKEFTLIPCLNTDQSWAKALAAIIIDNTK